MHTDVAVNSFLSYLFLSLALLLLCLRDRQAPLLRYAWFFTLVIATLLALLTNQLETIAIPSILLIAALAWTANRLQGKPVWQAIFGTLFTLAALALGLHLLPGFHPLNIYHKLQLTPDAIPYNLNLNFDKTLIGLFIFGLWYQRPSPLLDWPQTSRLMIWSLPAIILTLVLLSSLAGYIRWEPKLIDQLGLWMWANLFFTCSAEEAFFRGLIQHRLALAFKNIEWGNWLALLIAATLFGLAHLGGGWSYALLAIIAGLGYGYLYQRTGRIETSILAHFGLNLVHILLFTYPALSHAG